jgi:hypothetical protein
MSEFSPANFQSKSTLLTKLTRALQGVDWKLREVALISTITQILSFCKMRTRDSLEMSNQ